MAQVRVLPGAPPYELERVRSLHLDRLLKNQMLIMERYVYLPSRGFVRS